ncbi:Anaphase-promoting complex subunit 2 [Coemansia sp. RSA 1722]|nr:Anaphase-promoting complex subunit 2 [Coemansia sp. RSA 485]KAJ2597840.1 Anaphase-promoting complex subunit 2 [Coemansia sp. RSA 1722]
MDTSSYNLCSTFSKDELARIIQETNQQNIDCLASKYQQKLQQQVSQTLGRNAVDAVQSTDEYQRFAQLLASVNELGAEFTKKAAHMAREQTAKSLWQTLVFGLFDQQMLERVERWMFMSISCMVKILQEDKWTANVEAGVDKTIVAKLQQHHETGTPVILTPFTAGDRQLQLGEDIDIQLFANDVCNSSSENISGFINHFAHGCQALSLMQALKYTTNAVTDAIGRVVHTLVHAQANKWETPVFEILQNIVGRAAATIDVFLHPDAEFGNHQTISHIANQQLLKEFSSLRTNELFSIIIDYPLSTFAIHDLRLCVNHLGTLRQVAHSLRLAVESRLLHPGATTNDVLLQYISSIRCLRLLDPTNTVLEIVANPVRKYLRQRDDTVLCIVQDMVAEQDSELFEDLAAGAPIVDNDPEGVLYDEEYADRLWEPLPVEAKTIYQTAQRRDADVLSLLVSIYDSKDVFVLEFERHLAQKLLACTQYDVAREIRQVEMMKLRFGNRALEKSEVMLKDLAESKRTDQHVMEVSEQRQWTMPLHSIVVSKQFWPSQQQTDKVPLTMPREMREVQEKYAGVYESVKPARKLVWRDTLGCVKLKIELADRTIDIGVTPMQAAVLMAFEGRQKIQLKELAELLECPEEAVMAKLRFWISQGVLREPVSGTFEPAERRHPDDDKTDDDGSREMEHIDDPEDADDDAANGATAATTTRTDALRMHFNYIVGMLTNIGPLPLDRIHSMLGMFIPGDTTTLDELRSFLSLMVREDRLELSGGLYKLK